MRRVLFLLSCGMILWVAVGPVHAGPERSTAAEAPFEERVWAMVRAREVVGRETRAAVERAWRAAEEASKRVRRLAERLS